jgi:hypothetical protein
MQQTYQHPWYKQQELLENTTTSELESKPKAKSVKTGPKFTKSIEWAAGLFEGEGSLSYDKSSNCWKLKIEMTDLDTLEDFHAAVGYVGNLSGLIKPPSRPDHWKPYAIWATGARQVVFDLVMLFYNYLGSRRQDKVKEFLAWYFA